VHASQVLRVYDLWGSLCVTGVLEALNRNGRKPKKANKGARPCSSVQRKYRRKTFGRKVK
jgi:hypothetical protein